MTEKTAPGQKPKQKERPADFVAPDREGRTPMHYAWHGTHEANASEKREA